MCQGPSTPKMGHLSDSVQMALPPFSSWLNISRDTKRNGLSQPWLLGIQTVPFSPYYNQSPP